MHVAIIFSLKKKANILWFAFNTALPTQKRYTVSLRGLKAPERVFANGIPTNLWVCSHQRKQVFLLFLPSWQTSFLADEDFQDHQPKCSTWFQLWIRQMRHSKCVCSFKGLALCTNISHLKAACHQDNGYASIRTVINDIITAVTFLKWNGISFHLWGSCFRKLTKACSTAVYWHWALKQTRLPPYLLNMVVILEFCSLPKLNFL